MELIQSGSSPIGLYKVSTLNNHRFFDEMTYMQIIKAQIYEWIKVH